MASILDEPSPPPMIHEYLLETRVSPTSTRPTWYIRLGVKGPHWVDFEIYSVCYLDDKTNTLMFLPEGWSSSPEDARPWSTQSIKTVDGFIKWDGCTEFKAGNHFCHGAKSYEELHVVIQFTLGKAHDFLNAMWSPVTVFISDHYLYEVSISNFNRKPEVLSP